MANIKRKIHFDKKRLKTKVKEKGIKQNQLAKIIGRTYETIKIAYQTEMILPEHLEIIAKYLGVSVSWLTGEDEGINTKMRSQKERLAMAEVLLSGICEEFSRGVIENNIDQEAVNIQIDVNRIIFKLNEHRYKRFSDQKQSANLLREKKND